MPKEDKIKMNNYPQLPGMANVAYANNNNNNNNANNNNPNNERMMRANDCASANLQYAILQKAAASKAYLENHYGKFLEKTRSGVSPVVGPREKLTTVDDFHLIKPIGRGAFGVVSICQRKDDPMGRLYALKIMRKTDMLKRMQVMHVRSEKDILSQAAARNPWVVNLYASFQDKNYLYMLMEYMPGGDMITWLCNKGVFDYESARFYIAELCMAVASVHAMNFVHRDIKPDNILFGLDGHIKLSDFGLSKRFENVSDVMQDDEASGDSVLGERGSSSTHNSNSNSNSNICTNKSTNNNSNAILPQEQSVNNSSLNDTNNNVVVNVSTPLEVDMGNSLLLSNTSNTETIITTTTTTTTGCNVHATIKDKARDNTAANVIVSSPDGLSDTSATPTTTTTTNTVVTPTSSPTSSINSRIAKMLMFNSIVGSTGYVAPEILLHRPYGVNCDWWSVGIIMYEMLYGRTPFLARDADTTNRMVVQWKEFLRFPPNPNVTPIAIDFMKGLLCEQHKRMDFDEIKRHPYFDGLDLDHIREKKAAYLPTLSHPLDTRYFPEIDDNMAHKHRSMNDERTMNEVDPCNVLFADFRFNAKLRR